MYEYIDGTKNRFSSQQLDALARLSHSFRRFIQSGVRAAGYNTSHNTRKYNNTRKTDCVLGLLTIKLI
jgi:hypothetical protein